MDVVRLVSAAAIMATAHMAKNRRDPAIPKVVSVSPLANVHTSSMAMKAKPSCGVRDSSRSDRQRANTKPMMQNAAPT